MNKQKIFLSLLIIPIIVCSSSIFASDNSSDGKLVVNNEIIQLKYAYAVPQEGFFDNKKEDILVIISDVPLSEDEIEDSFDRKSLMHEGKLHCIEVVINENKDPISVTILHDAFKAPPSGRGYEILEVKTLNEDFIEGELHTSQPNEFFGTTYEFNTSFKAKIVRKLPPTEDDKKQAEGSIQAALYREYESSIRENDYDGLINLVAPEISNEMSREEASEMFEFMQMTMPDKVRFLRLTIQGQTAKMEMSGEIEGQIVSGKTKYILIDNEWKISETSWED